MSKPAPSEMPDESSRVSRERLKAHLPVVAQSQSVTGEARLELSGKWFTSLLADVDKQMADLAARTTGPVTIDVSHVSSIDTAGAWLIRRYQQAVLARGFEATLSGMQDDQKILYDVVSDAVGDTAIVPPMPKRGNVFGLFFESVGRGVYDAKRDMAMGLHILGAAIIGSQMKEGHKHPLSITPIIAQIDKTGVKAIPIVLLMATIIGAIIAQQGAFQLRYFGAEIFVVDLVSILVLREIGVLITAIMIAGRSGSSITAEIGSMRMREEVDALHVIGLNPIGVLVFPRLAALFISLILLTFMANAAALFGAMIVADLYSGISFQAFVGRMREAIDMSTFAAGLIKAPFMAVIIGVIASVEGMKVGGSAESLGNHVTAAVVKSIFVVIVVDGLFAIFFAAIDF
ncbi:MAG: ABC transporter permease [Ahrensia sp.]